MQAEARKKSLILFFNDFFDRPADTAALSCGDRCEFTADRGRLCDAAAVIFHIPSMDGIGRVKKYPGQMWVAWSMESRVNYPLLADRSFMDKFDIHMTYEQSADIWCPYLPRRRDFKQALATPIAPKTESACAVMLQSAAFDASGRNHFARELMGHMKIDSYGRFLNNRQLATVGTGREAKLRLIANYKFCLGFENSIAPDYVTEKFFDPLISGTIPVYRGAPNVDAFAPGANSFIDASKFAGPRELADFLIDLDKSDEAYRQYLAWREAGLSTGFEALLSRHEVEPFCQLCQLVTGKQYRPPSRLLSALAPRIFLGK